MDIELVAGPLFVLLLGYLLGSIPFGLIITRFGGAGDLRSIGSGNIGATNVLRTGRKGLAALTLLLDGLKGLAALHVAELFLPGTAPIAAIGALRGHLHPVWLRFRGGKGVATFFGIVAGFATLGELPWLAPAAFAGIWLAALALTSFSSVAGMAAALIAPLIAALAGRFDLALLFLGIALLVLFKHRFNLERLLAGTEPKVGRAPEEAEGIVSDEREPE